jgi:hypothetical protein
MRKFIPILIFFWISHPTNSQVLTREGTPSISAEELKTIVETGIDPRKYITVIYKRQPDQETKKSLAVWRWDEYTQHQKYKVVDKQGLMEIYFDKNKLANDIGFKGNVSLEANIKGKNGDRKIEVNPYSLIGVQSQEFGIKSLSPELTAQLLYNTILNVKNLLHPEFGTSFEPYSEIRLFNRPEINLILEEIKKPEYAGKGIQDISIKNKYDINNLTYNLQSYSYYPATLNSAIERVLSALQNTGDNTLYSDLETYLKHLQKEIENYNDYETSTALQTVYEDYNNTLIQLKAILAYLSSFDNSGEDAVSVFLKLIGKDKVKYRQILESLTNDYKKLSEVSTLEIKSAKDKIKKEEYNTTVERIKNSLFELSSITGSEFYKIVKDTTGILILEKARYPRNEMDSISQTEYQYLKELKKDEKKFTAILKKLSVISGTYLYSLLTFATVNLSKNDAKEGDKLYLYIKWWNFRDNLNHKDSGSVKIDEISLPIGVYDIKNTGWSTDVSESFYLIERINEPSKTTANLSPSNFKGAAGVSLMRTYNYCEYCAGTKTDKFFNVLQPSVGINLSYIDFYTTKDLELGLGLQLGIFSNSIFLGYGINLNGIRAGETKPTYFMLGLSFVNLAQKIKEIAGSND